MSGRVEWGNNETTMRITTVQRRIYTFFYFFFYFFKYEFAQKMSERKLSNEEKRKKRKEMSKSKGENIFLSIFFLLFFQATNSAWILPKGGNPDVSIQQTLWMFLDSSTHV